MTGQVKEERFVTRRITKGMTYYYTPVRAACPAKDFESSISPVTPAPEPHRDSIHSTPGLSTASPPLLLLFSWLGAQPGPVAKYRDLYLERGMDVLLVQSNVMHFLWPRWGLEYGLEVLRVLEEPQFSGRSVLVHASSIGGYTFTQVLTHISQEPQQHAILAQRVIGHIYDSLVVGTLEHMAIGE